MTTPRIRSLVSALTITLALGGCASIPSNLAANNAAVLPDGHPLAIRFDNTTRDHLHVYLVGARREWLLGRVEPGARTNLRIPDAAFGANEGPMRLAVLAGARINVRAAAEARAMLTIEQPATEILAQRWTFSQLQTAGQLTALRLR